MKQLGVDLKLYFNSAISYHQIDEENENFSAYHNVNEYQIAYSNEKTLSKVLSSADIFKNMLKKENETQFKI